MLTIQIKNGNDEVIAVINDIFSLQVDDEVNKGWKLKLRFPTEKRLQERPIQKADRISVSYGLKIWKTIRLFEWYITDVTLQTNEVQIEADNWLSYLQRRMIRSAKTYTWKPINQVISEIFTELNNNKELPVVLWLNDCDTQITKEFDTGTSFYDILKYCREAEPKLVVRVINEWAYNFLECSENGWRVLDWVREYDARNTRGWNIVNWKWKDSMDDFYSFIQNAWWSITNEEFLQRTNLLFENYEEEGALSLPSWIAIPSVSVSRDTDWWDFNIWDRKNIRILTGYDWLPLSYLWLIQSRKVVIDANGWIKAEIKISEDYKADTNILDLVLQNLRGRKAKWSSGDLENYYTKTETVNIINSAVSWKADVNHTHLVSQITDFAQAVSNMITSALAGYVTESDLNTALSWKADLSHTHTVSDVTWLETRLSGDESDISDLQTEVDKKANKTEVYTKTEIDTKVETLEDSIDWKANVSHTHDMEDVDGLETALEWKANTTHTHQTSDISWLDTALNNKADKSTTYTKTETDNLLSQKANSSHSHSVNDINWLSDELEDKADKTEIKIYAITEDIVTVTKDSTKGVSPYNTSYWYTNITIDADAGIEWKEWAVYSFVVNTEMVVASANRNVRVRIGTWNYIPVMNWANTILAGSSYFAKGQTRLFVYKSVYQSGWALHMTVDTTYSAMSVSEWTTGTATSARLMRADYLKQIIQYYIPTALSAFTNDTNFITNAVNDLVNYYKKSETYTKTEVNNLIGQIVWFTVEIVQTLPSTWNSWVMYLVPNGWSSGNSYDEYVWVASQSKFEKIWTTDMDLSNYIQKTDNLITINGVVYKFGDSVVTPNTTYETLTAQIIQTGTETVWKLISAKLLKDALDDAVSGKANTVHTHEISDVNGLSSALSGKANSSHSHAMSDITWLTSALSGKADSSHTHAISDITGLSDALDSKASSVHSHAISDITGLQSALDWKANSSDVKNSTITFKVNSTAFSNNTFTLNQSSNKTIDIPVTKSTVGLSNVDNTSDANKPISTAVQQALDGKANSTHNHTASQITDLSTILWGYLPLTWWTLTGNLTGLQGIFTLLKTTSATELSSSPTKIAVLDSNGRISYRTLTHLKEDLAIWWWRIWFLYDDEEIGYFITWQTTNKTIVIPKGSSWSDVTESFVRTMIYAGTGDYDKVFSATSGLYKILNALDELDNLGLTEWETWGDIVVNQTSMSMISHSYSAMVAVASSEVAMSELLSDELAVKEISEDWNSISIIAESELASDLYLSSSYWIKYLFTYQTAQDAFFSDNAKKQQIISDNIMTIVNDNTLLAMLYNDSTVASVIADNSQARSVIAWSGTKLNIVKTNSTIMTSIANDSSALGVMSDADFTTYFLESSSYLSTITSVASWQNRINSMSADDLLPAIFFWTGLSGYSTFADLASSDSAMAIVQSDSESMSIIECNDEAMNMISRLPSEYQEVEYIQSSWSQYINLWFTPPSNYLKTKIKLYPTQTWDRRAWWIYDWSNRANVHYIWMNNTIWGWFWWNDYSTWISFSKNTIYEIEMTANNWSYTMKINWQTFSWTYSWTVKVSTSRPYYLFANQENGHAWEQFYWRIYYFSVETSQWLIRDLVPCYRKNDQVIWLYDLVNNVFYTNNGSWNFTKWPDV